MFKPYKRNYLGVEVKNNKAVQNKFKVNSKILPENKKIKLKDFRIDIL